MTLEYKNQYARSYNKELRHLRKHNVGWKTFSRYIPLELETKFLRLIEEHKIKNYAKWLELPKPDKVKKG